MSSLCRTFRLHSHPISRMDQIASFLRTKLDVSNDCDIRLSVLDKVCYFDFKFDFFFFFEFLAFSFLFSLIFLHLSFLKSS